MDTIHLLQSYYTELFADAEGILQHQLNDTLLLRHFNLVLKTVTLVCRNSYLQ